MRILILSVLTFLFSNLYCQDILYNLFTPIPKNGTLPEFAGGESALYEFVRANVKYPLEARLNNVEGTSYVNFIIEKDGSVTGISVYKGVSKECDEEAMRVVKITEGMWKPGRVDGEPVRVVFTLPVAYKLAGGANDPRDAALSYNKGVDLMKKEKYEKALLYFAAYSPSDELYPDAIFASGVCRYMQSDYEGAITDWEIARIAGKAEATEKLALAYLNVGKVLQAEKNYDDAIACYTKSLNYVEDNIIVLYNRGISYMFLGDKENACKDWLRIRELGSQDAEQVIKQYCE
jgi:TonB family protein